ncbi:MAG: GDSL-type esterase/lipase family protein [Holophagales bacterium]|nr:GDSL-type esterase/lipase family protein [Holophagales bacterium]
MPIDPEHSNLRASSRASELFGGRQSSAPSLAAARPRPKATRLTTVFAASLIALGWASPGEAQEARVLAFGDSITHGLGDGNVSCNGSPGGYPPRLSDRIENRGRPNNFRTRGVCGETTSQGVSRLPGVLSSNSDRHVVILMEGTNDLSNPSISVESMRFNINTMVQRVLDEGMQPVLAAPIPRAPEAGSNARTGFLTSLLRGEAADAGIDFAETYDDLLNVRDLYDRFYSDPFHPNSSGYGLVAASLEDPTFSAIERRVQPEPCVAGTETLCLNGERFELEVEWEDFDGNVGRGQAEMLTSDTGYFWFFDEANIELVVKVLDGRELNGAFWVFFGALSDVEYTMRVRDSETGRVKTYFNPLGELASRGDTVAFPEESALLQGGAASPAVAAGSAGVIQLPGPGPRSGEKMGCETAGNVLCLNGKRFAVEADWRDFDDLEGRGLAHDITDDTGYFYFFQETNVELVVKVLDARTINGNYWLFYGSLSNVEFELRARDTETGDQVVYQNPLGEFGSRADVNAFPQPP